MKPYPYTLHFACSNSKRDSQAFELAEMAAFHEIRRDGRKARHIVSFTEDQIDLMAALYSLARTKPMGHEAREDLIKVQEKLREAGFFEFLCIAGKEPIDLKKPPSGYTVRPLKKPNVYNHSAFDDIRHYISLHQYEAAIQRYYSFLGGRHYLRGRLHDEFIYLKRLAGHDLASRDIIYYLPISAQSDLITQHLSEYIECIDHVLKARVTSSIPSLMSIIKENAPTFDDLFKERKYDHEYGVNIIDGKCVRNGPRDWHEPDPLNKRCKKGIFFERYPDQIIFCDVIKETQDQEYLGLWTPYSSDYIKKEIIDKGLHIQRIDAYKLKRWKRNKKEPDFTQAINLNDIVKQNKYGTFASKGLHFTGRSHKIMDMILFEVNITRAKQKRVIGNTFLDTAAEILRDSENRLRINHGLPAIGEGWISEMELFNLVKMLYPDAIHHASLPWLSPQHLDVFVPSQGLAFEYQGKQHYEPVEYFGGEEALKQNMERDKLKQYKCRTNGIRLIEWRYDEPINQEIMEIKIKPKDRRVK